jgi:hypothetical protein
MPVQYRTSGSAQLQIGGKAGAKAHIGDLRSWLRGLTNREEISTIRPGLPPNHELHILEFLTSKCGFDFERNQ